MIAYIQFFCASFVFFAALGAEELKLRFTAGQEVNFESNLVMQSEWSFEKHPVALISTQELEGVLSLDEDQEIKFPISMQFTLKDLKFTMREGNKQSLYSIDHPEQNLALFELKPWRGRSIPFFVTNAFPFIRYSEDFLRKFSGLKTLRYPLLTGLLGEELHTLFEIAEHPLVVGEGFETLYQSDEQLYKARKTFVVRAVTTEKIQIEVTTLIDRQKITLSENELAVISGQSHALWTIDRTNSLLFQVDERGSLTHSIRINDVETTIKYSTEKKVHTKQKAILL